MSRFFRSALFPLILIVLLVYLASQVLLPRDGEAEKVTYSEFVADVRSNPGAIELVTFEPKDQAVNVALTNEKEFKVHYPTEESAFELQSLLVREGVTFDSEGTGAAWWSFLTYLLPFVLFIAFWIFLMNQVQGGGSKVMSFGKSRAKRMAPDSPKITFKDVAGVDEAVEELHEIKEFLENPKKFQALGARIPKDRKSVV